MTVTKEKFLEIYSNMPLGIRKEIIVVIDSKPLTWNVAFVEISQDTALGKKILSKIESLGIIK